LKPQKTKKNIGSDITNQRYISFLSLDPISTDGGVLK
jgi:hypothetical protein